MIITCPKCNTKFKIADNLFGEKTLIKFQCSKCNEVFQYDRIKGVAIQPEKATTQPQQEKDTFESFEKEADTTKKGYPVYAVQAQKPREQKEEDKSDEDMEQPTTQMARQQEIQKQEKIEEKFESFESDENIPSTTPEEKMEYQPEQTAGKDISTITSEEPISSIHEDTYLSEKTPPQGMPAVQPLPSRKKPTIPPSRESSEVFLSGPYILELQYEWSEKPLKRVSGGLKASGIIAAVVIIICVVLYIFISARNDWNFAAFFNDPYDSILVAFGQKTIIEVAPEAKGLETVITESYVTNVVNNLRVFVVQGEVFNTTVFPKKQIRVYIEIKDRNGTVVLSGEAISGITLLTKEKIEENTIAGLMMYLESQRKTADEWVVNSQKKVSFQYFFPNPPDGIDDSRLFSISAVAVSAVNASSTPAML